MLCWLLSTARERQPRLVDTPRDGGFDRKPSPGEVAVTFIGHDTFLLRFAQADGQTMTVLTDPIFSERCSPLSFLGPRRFRAAAHAFADLPPIDLVLVSHCHYDHLDLPSLRMIARRDNPVVATPLGNGSLLRRAGLSRIIELDWWDEAVMGKMRLTCTPARHFAQRTLWDRGRRLWGGFFLRPADDAPWVFFAGDTAHGGHWADIRARVGAPDVALLPIGAYAPRPMLKNAHTDPVEAVAAFRQLGAKRGIAMHFDTFPLAREPLGEATRCLEQTLDWAGVSREDFIAPAFGETRHFTGHASFAETR